MRMSRASKMMTFAPWKMTAPSTLKNDNIKYFKNDNIQDFKMITFTPLITFYSQKNELQTATIFIISDAILFEKNYNILDSNDNIYNIFNDIFCWSTRL